MVRRLAAAVTVALGLAPAGAASAAPAAQPCTPVARVSGEPALVRQVVALLPAHSLRVDGESACGEIRAVVSTDEDRVLVTIVDSDGRVVERLADDVEAAVTTIESFARRDLSDPLLAARAPPPPPPQAGDDETPPIAVSRAEQVALPESRRIELGAAAEAGLSGDGGFWAGGRAHACMRMGSWCTGIAARYAGDTRLGGDSAELASSRSAADVVLAAELAGRRGRFSVRPGFGVGLTVVRAERMDLMGLSRDETAGPILRGSLAAGWDLSPAWSIGVDLAATWSPMVRTCLGECDRDIGDEDPLAGAPRWYGSVGLRVAYGGL